MAFILLCDQFSRNCFRDSPEAFSYDPMALEVTKSILADRKLFNSYEYKEKLFIIMPLLHAENADFIKQS